MPRTVAKLLERFEDGGLLVAFWALGAVVFIQFFSRYFLNMPLGWTEELARYLMIAVAFLGLPVVTRRGEHIAIDMLANALSDKLRPWLERLAELIQLAIVAVLAWQALALANLSSQSMSSLPLPRSLIYYAVLAGLVLHMMVILVGLAGCRKDRSSEARK